MWCKVIGMETNWAEENLKTIRTLMERSAIYRRALAPIMIFAGVVGVIAAVAGLLIASRFGSGFWLLVAGYCRCCALRAHF